MNKNFNQDEWSVKIKEASAKWFKENPNYNTALNYYDSEEIILPNDDNVYRVPIDMWYAYYENMSTKPQLIKAGDTRVKLGIFNEPPKVDIRVIAEEEYQRIIKLLERANMIINDSKNNILANQN